MERIMNNEKIDIDQGVVAITLTGCVGIVCLCVVLVYASTCVKHNTDIWSYERQNILTYELETAKLMVAGGYEQKIEGTEIVWSKLEEKE